MSLQGTEFFTTCHIPKLDRLVFTAGCQSLTVRTETDAIDIVSMSLQGTKFFATRYIPEFDRFVPTAGCQGLAVWAETNAIDIASMSFQAVQFTSLMNVLQGTHHLWVGCMVALQSFSCFNGLNESL